MNKLFFITCDLDIFTLNIFNLFFNSRNFKSRDELFHMFAWIFTWFIFFFFFNVGPLRIFWASCRLWVVQLCSSQHSGSVKAIMYTWPLNVIVWWLPKGQFAVLLHCCTFTCTTQELTFIKLLVHSSDILISKVLCEFIFITIMDMLLC